MVLTDEFAHGLYLSACFWRPEAHHQHLRGK